MLPSMPVLFSRDSQDAFGNKIEPSTSFFSQRIVSNPFPKQVEEPKVVPVTKEEIKAKGKGKKQQPEPIEFDENTFENALVNSYFNKVVMRFATSQNAKFIKFQDLLKTYDTSQLTPVDLYKRLEELFGDDNSDLLEEFLLFLTPSQALEVGRFSDHFMMNRMSKFLHVLQNTFSRKPTMLRKIIRAITTSINNDNTSDMKSKVLPLLRSSPRLTQMYRLLFSDEVPPDSLYEANTDTVNDSFLTKDSGYDVWHFEDPSQSRKNLCVKHDVDTMYLQGRVFLQYGKMLKASRVTYPYSKEPYRVHAHRLAHCRLSPTLTDEMQKTKKRSKKQSPNTKKLIKDFNDNNRAMEAKINDTPKLSKSKKNNLINDKKKLKELALKSKQKICKNPDNGSKTKKQKLDDAKIKSNIEIVIEKRDKTKKKVVKKCDNEKVDNKWTRDEDKTMLEILQGEARSDAMFCRIQKLLPHRSMDDIQERFLYVMNLLQQMSGSDVT